MLPISYRISTTKARDRLPRIVADVQDPRAYVVLTRHNDPVAAVVSMSELKRIWEQQDIQDVIDGTHRPSSFYFGKGLGKATNREAAEEVRRIQMDRRIEREVLKRAGMDPMPGGELMLEISEHVSRPRWWQVWRQPRRWLSWRRDALSQPQNRVPETPE